MLFRYLVLSLLCLATNGYDLVREYSGTSFFDRWDFYGDYDNLTLGDVWWLSRAQAFDQHLAYVNSGGNVVLKVDNLGFVPFNEKRNSVRITTQDKYAIGSLWIIDIVHLPYGCSVWPAFWTKGDLWPDNGEIDIVEGINLQANNQMALHTTYGCFQNAPSNAQTGVVGEKDCSSPAGCIIGETAPNSFREGFASAGGGVWATQFDVNGIFIWFWSRNNVPDSIKSSTSTSSIDVSKWGPPSAAYPANGCDITRFFTEQRLVLDITLCGIWAGIPATYAPACGSSGSTGLCYPDNVVGVGSPKYDQAYFEISHLRAYTTGGIAPTPTARVVDPVTSTLDGSATLGAGNGGRRAGQTVTAGSTQTRLSASSIFYNSARPGIGESVEYGVWCWMGISLLTLFAGLAIC